MEEMRRIDETKGLLSLLKTQLSKETRQNLFVASLLATDAQEQLQLSCDLNTLVHAHLLPLFCSQKRILEVPEEGEVDGEIHIGKVIQGDQELFGFALTKEELNQHMIITARSGCGKTTLLISLLDQLNSNGIPYLIVDFKRDFRHTLRLYPQLLALKWCDLRVNLLEPPPGVSFVEWKQQFVNLFGHVEGIWKGSTQYLLEAIDRVHSENNGRVRIEDVYNDIKASRETTRKFQDYSSVVESRLYGILSTLGDAVNNYKTLMNIEEILKHPLVLELDGLDRNAANLIVLWLFYWIYAYRRAQGIRGKLLHVLILDEAKRVFTGSEMYSQTTAEYSGIPPADLICDEIRDFGEAIIASDQEPGKLSDSLKANTYTKITSYLGNGKDIHNISEAMDLNDEERDALTSLERGEWLVKLAGRYTKPFLIRSSNVPLEKTVSDEEIAQHMKHFLPKLFFAADAQDADEKKEQPVELPKISVEAWALLTDINYHPFKSIVARYKTQSFSVRKAAEAKEELILKQLIAEVEVKLSKRRPTKFLVPTSISLSLLDQNGHKTALWQTIGRQGFEHQLYSVLIAYAYKKKGYQAFIEKTVSSERRVDVLVCGEKKIAIEIELGSFSLEDELKAFPHVDELILLVKSETVLGQTSRVLERFSADIQMRVRLGQIDQFLSSLRANYSDKSDGNNPLDRNKSNFNPDS